MADPKQLDILVSQSQSGVALRFDIYEVGGTACWWFEASPELVKQFVADALRTQPALSEHESTKPPLLTPGGRDLRDEAAFENEGGAPVVERPVVTFKWSD